MSFGPVPPERNKRRLGNDEDYEKDDSEIFVVDYYRSSESPLGGGYSPAPVEPSSSKSHNITIETMSSPNPFCPGARGVCCLLLLINLGLILLTLGFSVVLQIFEPPFVWYCGILFLLVGFIALIASLIFCVSLCRENRGRDPQLYWTHHWQKKVGF